MSNKRKYYIRKTHRYLGVFIGIQFLGWTLSGLYFSWTNIDEIHGDQFIVHQERQQKVQTMLAPNKIDSTLQISSLSLQYIDHHPFYWINESLLYDAVTGDHKRQITEMEARQIAIDHIKGSQDITKTELLTNVGNHHEYRERPLPAWAIHFDGPQKLIAYIDARNGHFERIRHNSWRVFDFLWMFHTMDYAGRDNFNNWILRGFSLFGLLTVVSGFTLYASSSKRVNKIFSTTSGNK